ncbi:PREDICTED: cell division cycle-associated protein 3 isoform X2 [Condylura cristata]|nr:PREDICTED: cell division cycle-associated protein 3 isoform X2 [Condylura cristata]
MGSAKSVPITPVGPPLHNKHLARVADPRSPSAGILRTPIQVESSPQPSLHAGEQLESPNQALDSDPRSPTLGIARTPMKTSSGDPPNPLMKQLSEVFESGAARLNPTTEPAAPVEAPTSSGLDLPLGNQFSLENQTSLWSETELSKQGLEGKEETGLSSDTSLANQGSDKSFRDSESPRSSGSKYGRRKPKGKVLGRSPLTVLQDDNSPGTLTSWQGKRPFPLSENVRDLKEASILGAGGLPKAGGRAWEQSQEHDKENQHFPLVEN